MSSLLGLARLEAGRVGLDLDLLDIAAVGVDLDGRDDLAAFVIVAVAELVAGGDGLHAHLVEEFLVVMGPGAADEHHGGLAFGAGRDLLPGRLHLRHLFGDHLLDRVDQFLVAEVLGDLAQAIWRWPWRR